MSTREFLSTVGFLFGLMGLLSLVELGIPLFHRDERSRGRGLANLGLTVVTFTLNWGLSSIAPVIAFVLALRGTGLLKSLQLRPCIIPVWTLGIPASAVVVYRLLSTANGLFDHANIRLWPALDRFLSFAWITPNMYKVHHSRAQDQTNTNYGNLLAVFDRRFRTFTPTEKASGVVYGLDNCDPKREKSIVSLLRLTFARRNQTSVSLHK